MDYLAPVLLTRRPRDTLRGNSGARIVNVGSLGQADLDLTDLQFERDALSDQPGAAVSPVPTVNVLHPETLMDTTMVRDAKIAPRSPVADGVANVLALLHGPAASGVTGRYFDRDRPAEPLVQARDGSARRDARAH